MQSFVNEHPFLFGFICWSVAVTLICVANYKHHNQRKKVISIKDGEEPELRFWDTKAMYDDLFLN